MDDPTRTSLDDEQRERYARHLTLPRVGPDGQRRLADASVLVVGAGGLGCPAVQYLAAAGIGRLGIVDFDRIERGNLQRQVLYATPDIGYAKVDVARRRVRALNPHVEIETAPLRLDASNALSWVRRYEVVVDGSDNFATRYALSDACVVARRPYVHGSVFRFEGHVAVFDVRCGPCYRCPFPVAPGPGEAPDCSQGGVLGVLPGLVGTIQATETIKTILGLGSSLCGRLLVIDALEMSFREIRLRRRPDCRACGEGVDLTEPLADEEAAVEPSGACDDDAWTPRQTAARLQAGDDLVLLDVRTPVERGIGSIAGSVHIPMDELAVRLDELDPRRRTVVVCHHGARSAMVVGFLRRHGFRNAVNLTGGMDAWSRTVDPGLPRY